VIQAEAEIFIKSLNDTYLPSP